ncbi:MAG TPA: CdaR family transcriptional regulator [Clostridiales bacterium]|nr:CdaR family transcriptional regulator [Clostridiales bacterium]
MLDNIFAERFIEKVTEYTNYNVNIMNEKGKIIASKDKERVGTFHEIAYRIIHGEEDIIVVEDNDNFVGVKSGINMSFRYDKRKVGVIGITGEPAEVKPIALMIKMSIETMLEYEIYKEKMLQRKNSKEQLMHYLRHGEQMDKEKVTELAKQLGYRENLIRIPILIESEYNADMEQLLSVIKKSEFHSSQDISSVSDEKQIIIFKHFNIEKTELFSKYKYLIGEYLNGFLNFIREENIKCKLYIGTFQKKFERYHIAYHHCQWLRKNLVSNNLGFFFYDSIGDYMKSLIPVMELYNVFNVIEETMSQDFKDGLKETVGVLENSNYNLVESSKKLFIHKNTLIFRFNKIREYLDINPMQKSEDREFLNNLYYYLENK